MERLPLSVPDLHCEHCLMTIRRQLRRLSGVEAVYGDVRRKTLEVIHEPETASVETILAAIQALGYTAARR